MTIALALMLSVFALPPQSTGIAQQTPAIRCEFRVFDGGDEVTSATRVRVYPDGQRANGVATDANGRISLAPGVYDVQAIRERNGQVAGIRWIEHLLIQRYPNEEEHLEAINLNALYGALAIQTGSRTDSDATAFPVGETARPTAVARPGIGYVLLVAPAGRYDVRVKPGRPGDASTPEIWMRNVEIQQGRTRLLTLPPG